MKTVVVLQSNYIPWKGYFDLIHDADLFIFYDNIQYTKNCWRNRNMIKTNKGLQWLTIPVGTNVNRLICDVEIKDHQWQKKHWNAIIQNYSKAPFFDDYHVFFEDVYTNKIWKNLSELNQYVIKKISKNILGLSATFEDSRSFNLSGNKLDRLIELLLKTKADRYISGPSAKDYIVPARFAEVGIDLFWKDYSGYPEYTQHFSPFEHGVSILDLIFNTGPNAPWYIWGWR